MLAAIDGQTVSIAGAEYAELGVAMSATDALAELGHRKEIEAQVLELIQDIPQTEILLSMPGIGPRSTAQILMTVGDMSDFPDAAHLASYAGLSPRTNQSTTSIMSNSPNQADNKKLKNALWQSSFASIRFHERSRQFYERKCKEGKGHNAVVELTHGVDNLYRNSPLLEGHKASKGLRILNLAESARSGRLCRMLWLRGGF